jgi:hypothetical protein
MSCALRSSVNVIEKALACNVTVVAMSLTESMLTSTNCAR